MAINKKSTNNKSQRACGKKGTLLYCWWECKLVLALWKPVYRLLKNLNIELPYDPAIPVPGIHPEKVKTLNLEKYMHPTVHSSTIYDSQDKGVSLVSTNR